MRDIPTDLLRAFVTVVDADGFTRASEALGLTQPAVSLQIRRLQEALGTTLLERKKGTLIITESGKTCLRYARRILADHDKMLQRLTPHRSGGRLRIGFPSDFADYYLPGPLLALEDGSVEAGHFEVVTDLSIGLLRALRDGQLDIALALSTGPLPDHAVALWTEPVMWVRAPTRHISKEHRVPIVAYPEGCLYRGAMLENLENNNYEGDVIYTASSLAGVVAAVRADIGVSAMARRTTPPDLQEAMEMPQLPNVTAGVYLGARSNGRRTSQIAARLAETLRLFPI
ncbi:LysR family transcriptional regulator [Acetobacter sp.]|jgi:DNA-binding transcriptional LysR family regulator|uniref:LysR family transcriptional regulator n=1 Tax=Acetobacter sp. TaxID=440 RepID=UPI0025BB7955|nr:LysR family transcriptional regulator [Acetobacter sp.]MCH4091592.1 LysR family transcriptional regulator [Acetobacter sp.]MCI1301156.1 LysR family transcriptional regulator [Acetobacter sp.]MCI1317440.1 LysR family transcriptional regulator [Acetobacter sp.]